MSAPQFPVNSSRYDPHNNFKIRVKWAGRYVASVSSVSGLTSAQMEQPGPRIAPNTPKIWPTRRAFAPIILEQGITHDTEFEKWANQIWNYGSGPEAETALKAFRKDIIIEVYNEAGQLAMAYKVYRCWVSEYQALPDLDVSANAVAIQHVKLENEGWERDYDVTEPTDPAYDEPPV